MWTYSDVHLYLTLPVIFIEWLLLRPFLNAHEYFKIAFICFNAFFYTVPWDNYIVYHDAWSYPAECVLGVIGWVPYEEYAFFVIQTILTSLWTILWMRWSIPCLSFNRNSTSYLLIRWIPMTFFAGLTLFGASIGIPATKTFYLGSLLWWICPVIMFMWYGAGNYFVSRWKTTLISVAIPSIYLCWVDTFSLREGIWHINEATSIEWFVFPDLPFEEALFFTIINFLIVLANCAFDKSKCIIDLYPNLYPLNPSLSWTNFGPYLKQTFLAFITCEPNLPDERLDDFLTSMAVLERSSKSVTAAASAFHSGIRIDLSILYGFARVTDDMIDNVETNEKRISQLNLITKFLDDLFANRRPKTWTYDVATDLDSTKPINLDWTYYQNRLTKEELEAFRALSGIVYYLPAEPFYELARCYAWDIEDREVKSEKDLLEYSNYASCCIGTLFTFIMCYKSGNYPNGITKEQSFIIDRAREMGQVLQIVNIARDIVTDSISLGRCYIPSEYMEKPEHELKLLKKVKDPWTLGQDKLKEYAIRMLDLADIYAGTALRGIDMLPGEVQAPVLATTEIYRMIGVMIVEAQGYRKRVYVSKFKKILIALSCMYARFMPTQSSILKTHSD